MWKNKLWLLGAVCSITAVSGQKPAEPFEFKEIKVLAATPVKSQEKTLNCWSFSTLSMLESELLRAGKGEHDLSEMYVARLAYRKKCENYVRRQGKAQFSGGGLGQDALTIIRESGIVPEHIYPAKRTMDAKQLDAQLKDMCDNLLEQAKENNLAANWLAKIDQQLDLTFGPLPEKFKIGTQEYTPLTYCFELGIQPDDFVNITSFTHHPFYGQFVLEIPDNWANTPYYNLPLAEMLRCLNFSIQQGFSVVWDTDTTNDGFSIDEGLAIVPELRPANKSTADLFRYWLPEESITPEKRQAAFDTQRTTDNHLMHITGILDETHSGVYYQVKNSFGDNGDRKGYMYASEAYLRLQTLSLLVNKNALPPDVRKRLGIDPGEVMIEKYNNRGVKVSPAARVDPRTQKLQPARDKAMPPSAPIKH